jgi:uncharacterized protein YdaU (DUF1376 family)
MDKPTPPDTELHRKLAHLTTKQRANVLAMAMKLAPKHNQEVKQTRRDVDRRGEGDRPDASESNGGGLHNENP